MRTPFESWVKKLDHEKIVSNILEIHAPSVNIPILYHSTGFKTTSPKIAIPIQSIEHLIHIVNNLESEFLISCFTDAIPSLRIWNVEHPKILKGTYKDSQILIPIFGKQQCQKIKPKNMAGPQIPEGIGISLHKRASSSQILKQTTLPLSERSPLDLVCHQIAEILNGTSSVALTCSSYDLFCYFKDMLKNRYNILAIQDEYSLLRGYHPYEDCLEYVFSKGLPLINLVHDQIVEIVYV